MFIALRSLVVKLLLILITLFVISEESELIREPETGLFYKFVKHIVKIDKSNFIIGNEFVAGAEYKTMTKTSDPNKKRRNHYYEDNLLP